jgi:hypothetical protein
VVQKEVVHKVKEVTRQIWQQLWFHSFAIHPEHGPVELSLLALAPRLEEMRPEDVMALLLLRAQHVVDGDAGAFEEVAFLGDHVSLQLVSDGKEDADAAARGRGGGGALLAEEEEAA